MEEKTSIKAIEEAAAEKAWELARLLVLPAHKGGLGYEGMMQCFADNNSTNILAMPYEEARKKYDAWTMAKKKRFCIGDEVQAYIDDEYHVWIEFIVTAIVPKATGPIIYGIDSYGFPHKSDPYGATKTGKHFDSVDEYLGLSKG